MIRYIKLGVTNNIFVIQDEMDSNSFEIGTTYEDYLDGKYVKLSDEQVDFAENHPDISIKEIWDMQCIEHSITLEEMLRAKLSEIDYYDTSSSVNEFYFNDIPLWFDKDTRVGLMNSTTILKNAGEETTTLWYDDIHFTLPCETVISILSQLEIYALNCYNVTAQHKSAVRTLTTVEDIENYNIEEGYPEKLHFTL